MKLVIIGGTGLIGSKLVTKLREQGHEAVSPSFSAKEPQGYFIQQKAARVRGLRQESGWEGLNEPRPPSESSIEREFRLRRPADDDWGRSESLDPDNVGDIADEGAGHRGQRSHMRGVPMNVNSVSNNQKPDPFQRASIDHDALRTRLLAGVNVPDSPRITAVIEQAQRLSEPYLFNHAMRS